MITTLRYIITNLGRRPLRAVVTALGVAVAIATVFSLISFQRGYQAGLKADMDRLGAHLLVVPKGCPYDAASIALHGATWPCYLKMSYLAQVASTPHVAVAAPVLMSAIYLPSSEQVVYCGVERNILQLKRSWHIDGSMVNNQAAGPSPVEMVTGSAIAKAQGWKVGDVVKLPGLTGKMGKITGILQSTGGADDLFVYMPMARAQQIFDRPNQITHILVRLDDPEKMDDVVSNLRGCDAGMDMNVVPLAHLYHTIQALIESTRLLLYCVALIAIMAAGAGLSNTILMAVNERTREIGVLRALGASQGHIFRIVWSEAVLLCTAGAVVGIAASIAASHPLEAWFRANLPYAPTGALITPDAMLVIACIAGAVVLGSIASAVPAGRAARMSPALSVRAVGGEV